MQHIIQTLDVFADRLISAKHRIMNLNDRLVGPPPPTPERVTESKLGVPPLMYHIGLALDNERELLDELFREINRLEEALQMNSEQPEPAPAKGYTSATRLGGGLL